jgi:hypothetical protein
MLVLNAVGGFEKERNCYTPQGEYTYLQCTAPCRHDAVFDARPIFDELLPQISEDGHIPDYSEYIIFSCSHCGGEMVGNVRAGRSFLHTKYELFVNGCRRRSIRTEQLLSLRLAQASTLALSRGAFQ